MTEQLAAAWPEIVPVGRRGPVLRESPTAPGTFGVDLTAGCGVGCSYCYIRAMARYPGESRVSFDPYTAEAIAAALQEKGDAVRTVVLSPTSDPLPPFRPIRSEAVRVARLILEAGKELVIMTRGRVPRALVTLLAAHPGKTRVAIGMLSLNRKIVRAFEPRGASPRGRVADVRRLTAAGVPVEIRLEPLLPHLTDTRDNLAPLFHAVAEAGATRVVAHYMFMHRAIWPSLEASLAPFDIADSLHAAYQEGPPLAVGSVGTVRNLPRDVRRAGMARVLAWGAEFGLAVTFGAAQNPDLQRAEPPRRPQPAASGRPTPHMPPTTLNAGR